MIERGRMPSVRVSNWSSDVQSVNLNFSQAGWSYGVTSRMPFMRLPVSGSSSLIFSCSMSAFSFVGHDADHRPW